MRSIFLFVILFFALSLSSQCPPGNVFLTTQDDVNAFFENYPDCNKIEGDLNVAGGDIVSLLPLMNVDTVLGDLEFSGLAFINNFQQFGEIIHVGGDLNIFNCTFLANLLGLETLEHVGGELRISDNPSLNNFNGLGPITEVTNLRIFGNSDISQIDGLNSLQTITGFVQLVDNTFLQNTGGLSSLLSVGANITIDNNGLNELELPSLESISGSMFIINNTDLEGLNDLNDLISITGRFEIDNNPMLTSLEGLDHPIGIADSIIIRNNASLEVCDEEAICMNIENGQILIVDNAEGCNNLTEVEAECLIDGLEENNSGMYLTIYPNPARERLFVSLTKPAHFAILDISGRTLHSGITKGDIELPVKLNGYYLLTFPEMGISQPIMVD